MSLDPQAERLETLDKLERAEGVQAGTEITEDLDTNADSECDRAKGLPEF